jgi:HSP20 family protein
MFLQPTALDLILGNPYTLNLGRTPPSRSRHWYLNDDEEEDSDASRGSNNAVASNNNNSQSRVTYTNAPASVKENDNEFILTVDVPGVKSKDVDIQIENNVLRLVAERKTTANKVVCKYVQHFMVDQREVKTEAIRASLADGVLTVSIPKKEESAPVIAEVQAVDVPVVDENKTLMVTSDAPGFKPSDLNVSFHKGCLTVHGESKTGRKLHRTMALNETKIDVKTMKAYLMDGVLTITMDRTPVVVDENGKPKPKQIAVTSMSMVEEKNKKKNEVVKTKKDKNIVVETAMDDDDDDDNDTDEKAHGEWHNVTK